VRHKTLQPEQFTLFLSLCEACAFFQRDNTF
jgi:hypothetical protein